MKSIVHLLKSSSMIKVNWKNFLNILDNSVYLLEHQCRIYSWNILFVALQLPIVEDFATIARKEFHLLHLGMSCDQFCACTSHTAHLISICCSKHFVRMRQKCICDLFKKFFKHTTYGNMGFQISRRGIQNYVDFWPKINILQGNFFFVNRQSVKLSKNEHYFRN